MVAAMSESLSARSLAERFFAGTPRIPRELLKQLAAIDHDRIEAVIAVIDGTVIGLAQYARLTETSAELAVLVADAWQRNGVARMLVTTLAELAAARGITCFEAGVLPDNAAARLAIAGTWPGATPVDEDDCLTYLLPIGDGYP